MPRPGPPYPSIFDLLMQSDFARLNPERAHRLAAAPPVAPTRAAERSEAGGYRPSHPVADAEMVDG